MARFSRDSKRKLRRAGRAAGASAPPVAVRVPGAAAEALVDGVPVVAAPGQEIQQAVLAHLHRIAVSTGRPVLATVHDDRIGFVVPLRVDPDGSSRFTAEPVRTAPPDPAAPPAPPAPLNPPAPPGTPTSPGSPTPPGAPAPPRDAVPTPSSPEPAGTSASASAAAPEDAAGSSSSGDGGGPRGTVVPSSGGFGPPPGGDGSSGAPAERARRVVAFVPEELQAVVDEPRPAPVRGFDAVAEAVLCDAPLTAAGHGPGAALLAEPTARVNEAVRAGRTQAAARLAEQTVAWAAETLGPEHPEVLGLRLLTAYIAYLSDDPVRAARICLDLARVHGRAGDGETAYGSLHGAVTAWRAVRDPEQGLELGHELIALWDGLVAGGGPAAGEPERLESARARMTRLAERARARRSQ